MYYILLIFVILIILSLCIIIILNKYKYNINLAIINNNIETFTTQEDISEIDESIKNFESSNKLSDDGILELTDIKNKLDI